MHASLRYSIALVSFCILLALPSQAEASSALLNGSDGGYWGISQAEVSAKAPGEFTGEKKMAGFVGLVYMVRINDVPVEVVYTLKDDKCWKITITTEKRSRGEILPIYEAVVAALTKSMGQPTEKKELEDISNSTSWDGDATGASVYCTFTDGKAQLDISYESKELARAIWGKLAG